MSSTSDTSLLRGHALDPYIPGSLLSESSGKGWDAFLVRRHELPVHAHGVEIPAVAEHSLVLHLAGQGEMTLAFDDEPEAAFEIKPGMMHLRRGGSSMRLGWRTAAPVVTLSIYFRKEFVASILEGLGKREDETRLRNELIASDPMAGPLLMAIARAEVAEPSPPAMYVDGLGRALLAHLFEAYGELRPEILAAPLERSTPADAGLDARTITRITAFVREHVTEEIALDDLAAIARMSSFHFSRRFKAAMGLSPYQHVLQERLSLARRLMLESEHSLAHIAQAAGFGTQSHFTNLFKKNMGTTPGKWRKAQFRAFGPPKP